MSTSKLIETINSELISEQLDEINVKLDESELNNLDIATTMMSNDGVDCEFLADAFNNSNTHIVSNINNAVNCEQLSEQLDSIELELDKIETVVTDKLNESTNNDLSVDQVRNLDIITSNKSDEKVDRELLSEEFDEMDIETNYKYNSKYSYDEVSPNDDPADLVDIFPNMLGNENRYYPKFWY